MTVGELNQDAVHLAAHEKRARLPFPTLPVPPIRQVGLGQKKAGHRSLHFRGCTTSATLARPGFRSHLNLVEAKSKVLSTHA
jgi:hypothetical protein